MISVPSEIEPRLYYVNFVHLLVLRAGYHRLDHAVAFFTVFQVRRINWKERAEHLCVQLKN